MNKIIKNNLLILLTVIIITIITVLFVFNNAKKVNNGVNDNKTSVAATDDIKNLRILSLAPSITEYVYDLGLGDQLIANTTYCNYPPEAIKKDKVASFNEINYEAVLKLNINTAIIQQGMVAQKDRLTSMGIKVIQINNNTIKDMIEAYDILGKELNIQDVANQKKENVIKSIEKVKEEIKNKEPKTVVISIFREFGKPVQKFTTVGKDTFYQDIMDILNVKNPYYKESPYPEVNIESLVKANPDMILDLYHSGDKKDISKDWDKLKIIKAVQNKNVVVLTDKVLSLPGPRIAEIINKFYEIIYKENK